MLCGIVRLKRGRRACHLLVLFYERIVIVINYLLTKKSSIMDTRVPIHRKRRSNLCSSSMIKNNNMYNNDISQNTIYNDNNKTIISISNNR